VKDSMRDRERARAVVMRRRELERKLREEGEGA
jgi:hypothetical protein